MWQAHFILYRHILLEWEHLAKNNISPHIEWKWMVYQGIFRLIENFIMVAYMSTVYDLYMSKMFAIQVLFLQIAIVEWQHIKLIKHCCSRVTTQNEFRLRWLWMGPPYPFTYTNNRKISPTSSYDIFSSCLHITMI